MTPYDPASPVAPSFTPDLELEAKFPRDIDGVPVTDLNSFLYIDYLCFLGGGQAAADRFVSNLPPAIDYATFIHGYADVRVDGEEKNLAAFRTPGQDANVMIQSIGQFGRALGTQGEVADVSTATIGGKNVTVVTSDTGGVDYLYATGDVLFLVHNLTDSQASKIFAALP